RLAVLTEMPEAWEEQVRAWREIGQKYRGIVDDEPAPSAGDEYLFYQTALGATPFGPDSGGFAERVRDAMIKSAKEAKLRTSWPNPNAEYEAALATFVTSMLADGAFMGRLRALADATARHAATNALGQTVVKLTGPGVPDTYQGTELWSFALVDPDNR